ncbi:MAG: hypothetical protein Q7T66_09025 [Herminiimonas sp.]|uniref:COG4648 family protein n=1 Tax=Herminiimonas sp. TaxID=1926289 RepID=UPI002720BCA0|nr:hypothetical protein [Herminiimonas sp.]MDO9420792.1 hypothetical protein [Herminiimonas sp.]
MPFVKTLLFVAAIIVYVSLSHVALMVQDAQSIWRQIAVFMLVVPIIGIAAWGTAAALKQVISNAMVRLVAGLTVGVVLTCITIALWSTLLVRLDWIYLIQHIACNTMLCWFFAQTLLVGRTPIITTLARTIHPDMPDDVVRYTRTVTAAWAIFFAMQLLVSLLIFYVASIETWSVFANILNWPLVILMFVGEYFCRKRVNPDFKHATIKESVSAYFNSKNKV